MTEQEIVASVYFRFGIGHGGMATEDDQPPVSIHLFQKRLETGMVPDIDLMPVVQPRPLEVFVVHLETKGVDQVKRQFGSATQTGNIAGVCGNFRLIEDHMEVGIIKGPMFDTGDGSYHGSVEPICSTLFIPGLALPGFTHNRTVNGQAAQLAKAVQDLHLLLCRDLLGGKIDPQNTVGGLVHRKGDTDDR